MNTSRKLKKYPKGLRAREQRSKTVHYYYESPKAVQRTEVALGSDFQIALAKRAMLLMKFESLDSGSRSDFQFISKLYLEAYVPTLPAYDQGEVRKSLVRLQLYFKDHQLTFCSNTISEYKTHYLNSRGSNAKIRGTREWTLLWVILRWVSEFEQMTSQTMFHVDFNG
jgi:hypothetical protein